LLEGFICPNGSRIKIEGCFTRCQFEHRCMTLPSLALISSERKWTGRASTTQLLLGTMEAFLKLTKPYYTDPDKRAFMMEGIKHHKNLEVKAKELGIASEVALSIDKDIVDLLEWENGDLVLTDYKLWGSFKVAKALGIEEAGKQPDPSGATYKSSGKWGKAGSPKMVSVFRANPDKADNWEAELQLNNYRVKATPVLESIGLKISRMQVQATVRDGGLYIAKDRGIDRRVYTIPVPVIPDEVVIEYFITKQEALNIALEQGHWDWPCNEQECWGGNKCEEWCDVWEFCGKGRLVHDIGGKNV